MITEASLGFTSKLMTKKGYEHMHACLLSLFEPTMGRCRAGRAARKRRQKQESAIRSGINYF